MIDVPDSLRDASTREEVLELRRQYQQARRLYRTVTGRTAPRLNTLQRLASSLYGKQGDSYDQHERPLYEHGVQPRLVEPLERRTPELQAMKDAAEDDTLPATYFDLRNGICDMVGYACYRALLRVPFERLEIFFDEDVFWEIYDIEESQAVRLAHEMRREQ